VKNLRKIHSRTFIPQLPNGRVWCWHNRATSRWSVQETKKTKTQKMLCMAWRGEVPLNPLNQPENRWLVRWVSFCFRQKKTTVISRKLPRFRFFLSISQVVPHPVYLYLGW
jgi:hypothetical protein